MSDSITEAYLKMIVEQQMLIKNLIKFGEKNHAFVNTRIVTKK